MEQNRLLYLLSHFLGLVWNFFRLPFPGTNVAIGAILFLPMVVTIVLAFFRHVFGLSGFGTIPDHIRSTSSTGRSQRASLKSNESRLRSKR